MDKLEKALQKARAQREIELNAQREISSSAAYNTQADAFMASPPTELPLEEASLERHHIVAHRLRHKEADIFRILRTQILQTMAQSGFKTLGITSPNYGDGKTTISLNLAMSIALDLKQTVLLADLDLRKPNVMEYLGLESAIGITDYFTHNVPISDCLIHPSFERLTILPAGYALDNSSEVLGSPKIAALASELRTRYADRLIIYDLPPTLAQDDPIAFLPNVDCVLLVINDGVTRIEEIKQSMNTLARANVIGTVLNHSRPREESRKFKKMLQKIRGTISALRD